MDDQNPPQENRQFQAEEGAVEPAQETAPHHEPITWSGSEFISQHKSAGWYFGLLLFILAACAVIYILSKDILSVVFVSVVGMLFAIIASKKPRQMQYMIDDQGIIVGSRHYFFSDFKSFSLIYDGAIGYISLLPLQRLGPELTIYFAPEDEQRIFEALATYLPHQERGESSVDKFAKRMRF